MAALAGSSYATSNGIFPCADAPFGMEEAGGVGLDPGDPRHRAPVSFSRTTTAVSMPASC
jgi:hypothetical protein